MRVLPEFWFVVDHIAMDGGEVPLIGPQLEGDAVRGLGGEDHHGWLGGAIDNQLMGDHVLSNEKRVLRVLTMRRDFIKSSDQ